MITAVDTSVLIDVLIEDPSFADCSVRALQRGRREGQLIVCDLVIAELVPIIGEALEEVKHKVPVP